MSENEENLDNQETQSVGDAGQPAGAGEFTPVVPKKPKVRRRKAASPAPEVKHTSGSAFDITLNDLPLLERNKEVRLDELELYEIRARDMKVINDYLIRRKTSMPPNLTTVDVGSVKPIIVDGITRYIAAGLDGADTITVDLYKGTWEQVKLLALKLNRHGKNLTLDDIKRQIDQFDDEYKDSPLSTRRMAELVGISHTAVAAHRATRGQSVLESIKSMRRGKTPDEKRAAMVKSVLRMVEEQGTEVFRDIAAALPVALRKVFLEEFSGEN